MLILSNSTFELFEKKILRLKLLTKCAVVKEESFSENYSEWFCDIKDSPIGLRRGLINYHSTSIRLKDQSDTNYCSAKSKELAGLELRCKSQIANYFSFVTRLLAVPFQSLFESRLDVMPINISQLI